MALMVSVFSIEEMCIGAVYSSVCLYTVHVLIIFDLCSTNLRLSVVKKIHGLILVQS